MVAIYRYYARLVELWRHTHEYRYRHFLYQYIWISPLYCRVDIPKPHTRNIHIPQRTSGLCRRHTGSDYLRKYLLRNFSSYSARSQCIHRHSLKILSLWRTRTQNTRSWCTSLWAPQTPLQSHRMPNVTTQKIILNYEDYFDVPKYSREHGKINTKQINSIPCGKNKKTLI